MVASDPMTERQGRMLGRLAEINLSAAEILHGRLVVAQSDEAARDLALALQRVSRSVRQTLLMEAKLARDARAEARADAAHAEKARGAEAEARKASVRQAVGQVAMEACETLDAVDDLLTDLDEHLELYVACHDFEAGGVEGLAAAICKDLGLEPKPARPAADERPKLVQAPGGGWAPDSS
ncbi:hypothetical protein [Phenylobacterium sp.]|uniref:hypothetical protein n=1 Tax=Phenylobacterium sp. TaxID=1871053 RepID=UPI002DE85F7C|nr:hypothetical protein [Phenylobacterium sp.]